MRQRPQFCGKKEEQGRGGEIRKVAGKENEEKHKKRERNTKKQKRMKRIERERKKRYSAGEGKKRRGKPLG